MKIMRSQMEVDSALALSREGLTTSEIARRTGIPRSTVKEWLNDPAPRLRSDGCAGHDLSLLDDQAYAYLLGMYLGDGCIAPYPRGVWRLRITLDSVYPGIVAECARTLEAVAPGRAGIYRRGDSRATDFGLQQGRGGASR
jgi:hypothetical protein